MKYARETLQLPVAAKPGAPARLSRRALLSGSAALIAACSVPRRALPPQRAPIGIQLYTVRGEMKQDVPGTLARIAKIGYQEVEFAGYFGHTPAQIRRMVADVGLRAPSSHINVADLRADPARVVADALEAGHEFVVLAWLPPEQRATLAQWQGVAELCNRFGAQCRSSGLRFAYHNHDFEFAPIDGTAPYDLLLQLTEPAIVQFELDMYWARKGGRNLVQLLQSNRGRIVMCHVKDMLPSGAMTDVGLGTIDFAAIFARHDISPMEHYFVENDDTTTPFESAAISYRAMLGIVPGVSRRGT